MNDHRREASDDYPRNARPHPRERAPPRTGGRQVGEGQPHAGLQAGDVVTLQFLIGQIGQKLAQEHKRQQEGEVGQTAGEEGRHDSVDEAAQEAEQAKQVGLGLPAEVADARKERRKKGDLRPPWNIRPSGISGDQLTKVKNKAPPKISDGQHNPQYRQPAVLDFIKMRTVTILSDPSDEMNPSLLGDVLVVDPVKGP